MDKYKETSLQEERGRSQSPYYHQEEDTLYSYQKDTSSRRSEKRREDTYFRQGFSSNRDRSQTPYSQDFSSNRDTPYSRLEDSRNRSQGRYSYQKDSSLNRNRGRATYSRWEDSSLNTREKEGRERNIGRENNGRDESSERFQEEIAELRSTMSDLIREVKELRDRKEEGNQTETRHSLSPDPLPARYTKARKNLEPMDHAYKKAFRDEVIQILKGLDNSLFIDHTKRWLDIERNVSQNILPAIKRALGNRFQYTDIELKKILQNLHRHRRDSHNTSMNPSKLKMNKQRTGTNSRRKDKKERRQRGFRHMVNIKDQKLIDLQPSIPWDDWVEGLDAIINNSSYHSDEVSESDTEKVQEEKNINIRLSRNESSNHVLHVYDKQWRSSRIRNLLRHADVIGESIQNIKVGRKRWYNDQSFIEDNSKPPHNAPAWAISSSYHSDE